MTDTQAPSPISCDIFCHVVDNFGDAGVCWRLARTLSSEEGMRVTLYVDDLATLARLVPAVNPDARAGQAADSVTVLGWEQCLRREPSECVIETFGCRLPDEFEEAIARRSSSGKPCAWLNLEYLSAEDWVEECHGLPSPHPRLPVTKTFLCPGFTEKTGGIIIERGLEESRLRFGEADRRAFLASLGARPGDEFRLFYFSYPSLPAAGLAESLAADPRPVHVLAAPGAASDELERAVRALSVPQVRVSRLPAVEQSRFDRLLWCADALVIRGEDSFVRAQLAQKPFLWSIYPQDGDTHIVKLNAFIDRVAARAMDEAGASLWRALQNRWNRGEWERGDWARFRDAAPALGAAARKWRAHLASLGSLSSHIACFAKKQLE